LTKQQQQISIQELINNEISALLSIPTKNSQFINNNAVELLSLWGQTQRFKNFDKELFYQLDNIIKENREQIIEHAYYMIDPQELAEEIEEQFSRFDWKYTDSDSGVDHEIRSASLFLFEEIEEMELVLWAIKKLSPDFDTKKQDDLKNKTRSAFKEALEFFELASGYYLHLWEGFKYNFDNLDKEMKETLEKFKLLEEYCKQAEEIKPLLDKIDETTPFSDEQVADLLEVAKEMNNQ